jgi:protoglobin
MIGGYAYGSEHVARSPVSLEELRELETATGLTEEDRRYLRLAGDVLADQAEAMVDAWRAKMGAQEQLAKWFYDLDGKPDERYKAAIKPRFVQWVSDLCMRPYDQAWLDYQEEIGRRHAPDGKNVTDHAQTPPLVPLRYVVAFSAVVITTARGFLASKGHSPEDVERMHAAWTKSVTLTISLWARPFAKEGLW